jgi:tetratricopeptide (TPR) repeat protein
MDIYKTFNKAISAQRNGQVPEAKRMYESVLRLNCAHPEANHNLGLLYLNDKDFEKAISHCKAAVQSAPYQGAFWLSYAESLIQAKEFDCLENLIGQATAHGLPKNVTAGIYKTFADALRKSSNFDSAERAYLSALELTPNDTALYACIAAVLRDQGKLEEAIEAYGIAIQVHASDPDLHVDLGLTLKDLGKNELAEQSYLNALKLDPSHSVAHNNLGTLLKEVGRAKEALKHYKCAIKTRPDQAVFHFNLANTFTSLKKETDALESYKVALDLNPGLDTSIAKAGKLLLKQGQYVEGLERLRLAEGWISLSQHEISIH